MNTFNKKALKKKGKYDQDEWEDRNYFKLNEKKLKKKIKSMRNAKLHLTRKDEE